MHCHYDFFDNFPRVDQKLSFFFRHLNFKVVFPIGLFYRGHFFAGGIDRPIPQKFPSIAEQRKIRAHVESSFGRRSTERHAQGPDRTMPHTVAPLLAGRQENYVTRLMINVVDSLPGLRYLLAARDPVSRRWLMHASVGHGTARSICAVFLSCPPTNPQSHPIIWAWYFVLAQGSDRPVERRFSS